MWEGEGMKKPGAWIRPGLTIWMPLTWNHITLILLIFTYRKSMLATLKSLMLKTLLSFHL